MDLIAWFVDLILHLDAHLVELLRDYGVWVYLILFVIIFAETGLVVTPFLPGDSLLFAAGALSAVDTSGTLSAPLVSLVLVIAAVAGNTTNYHVGRWIGPQAFSGKYRFLKVEYLKRTEAFFAKYGSMTIVLSRFVPIIRTCAPFVRGIARMPVRALPGLQPGGGLAWVLAASGPASSSATFRSSRTTSGS
jgi:membrane-associated protein